MFKLGRWLLGLSLIISLLLALSLSYQISEAEAPTTILSQSKTIEYLTVQEVNDSIDILCGKYNFPYFSLMKWLALKESSLGQDTRCGDDGFSCGLYQYKKSTWEYFQKEFDRYDLNRGDQMDQIEMTVIALKNGKWKHWSPLKLKYNVDPINLTE